MKEKLPLVVGVVLPLILILYVGLVSYVPSLFAQPKYNFLYASADYNSDVIVNSGRVEVINRGFNDYNYKDPQIYLYNVAEEKSTPISLTEAQVYQLDPSDKSPDGFTVQYSNNSAEVFPFYFGGSNYGYYLKGKGLNKKIETGDRYNFRFLGWIMQ